MNLIESTDEAVNMTDWLFSIFHCLGPAVDDDSSRLRRLGTN